MNNKWLCVVLGMLSSIVSTAYAQYEMDLTKVAPTPVKYIEMGDSGPSGKEIRVNNLYMEEGGKPVLPVMGEFHYVRMDYRYWKDTLLKMKSSGVNIVSTYVLWSLHEEREGYQLWTENYNLRYFVQLCAEVGLKVHLRIGPYCNAEIRNGALPDWLVNNDRLQVRSNDPLYLEYVRNWYKSIFQQVRGLLYKDGGPVMAIQLENEYVTKGKVISHLMTLKKMAVDIGFDLPLYSMTHWMDSEYPKGEIVPYAGFYIETPWVPANGRELPPAGDFEYFTYNRLSNNIGTDLIKVDGEIESLDGAGNESPFFTCELGVGTTTFYHRRAVVPEEMAGENINLRLGCGTNLMGYYMYVGGTNPIGEKDKFANAPTISYDYQAPIREFGTLGVVMKETKKLNYFMNDFGTDLAPKTAYLPIGNKKRDNLQWAVRSDGKSGYLFCSNYLYRHSRKAYDNVQFKIKLNTETITIPRNKVQVPDKAYFLWPFNLRVGDIVLKYATVQPICKHVSDNVTSYFFFSDDNIPAEYFIEDMNIEELRVDGGRYRKEKGGYFIDGLAAGKCCVVSIIQHDGKEIRLVTLTEKDSDYIWKGKVRGKDFVAITRSILTYDGQEIRLADETPEQEVWMYTPEAEEFFSKQSFVSERIMGDLCVKFHQLPPMAESEWISSETGSEVKRFFVDESLSPVSQVILRYISDGNVRCLFNGLAVTSERVGDYWKADITSSFVSGKNLVCFEWKESGKNVMAEIEVIYKNGERSLWNTDNTWFSGNNCDPVKVRTLSDRPQTYAEQEYQAVYQLDIPNLNCTEGEVRTYIQFVGDMAEAYIGSRQINDYFYNGTNWILGLSRYAEQLKVHPLVIKIKGFASIPNNIYFENIVDRSKIMKPSIEKVYCAHDYYYLVK